MRRALALLLAVGSCACQGQPARSPSSPSAVQDDGATADSAPQTTDDGAATEPSLDARTGSDPLRDGRAPDPTRALPRLGIKQIGLHVGGGAGSAEERQALLRALGQQERPLLDCYRLVDRPGVGGTFGVDLYVGAKGGRPEVRAVRHKLGGPAFETCMTSALGKTAFGPQVRAIVVSYSLRFELSP